ncbi:hypothetical protein LSAT2_030429 [Lamellibrachia satsuma]|nr:hypothetical protein LSAT2_030429 [Lamellibrachia satsuma]
MSVHDSDHARAARHSRLVVLKRKNTRSDSTPKGHNTSLERRPSCGWISVEETMRASVALGAAFLTLAFVAAYAVVEKEADAPNLPVNEDRDEASGVGARVKRATAWPQPPSGAKEILLSRAYPWGGCGAYYWGYEKCHRTWYGVYCRVHPKRYGGCIVYVYQKGHWRWCRAEGDRGARCKCYHDSTNNRVKCYSP